MKNTVRISLVILCLLFLTRGFAQNNTDEQLAIQYYTDKEYAKAVEIFEQLFNKKNNAYYYVYYLQSLIEMGDFKKAEKIVKKLQHDYPNDLKYLVDLGYVYISSNEPAKAKDIFEDAIKKITANSQQVIDLANAFFMRRQTEYAINTYKAGRKVLKTSAVFNMELAYIYESTGNFPDMMGELLDFAEQNASSMTSIEYYLQNSLNNDPENKKNDALRSQLLQRIQRNPELITMIEMLYWLSLQQKEFDQAYTQAKSLDKRQNEKGDRVYNLAGICLSNKNYDVAVKAFEYLISKGPENVYYLTSQIQLLNTKYLKTTSKLPVNITELSLIEKEYHGLLQKEGYNSFTIELIRNLAHIKAFYLNELPDAIKLLEQAIAIKDANPNILAECKIELADVLLFSDDVWEASLLYSQVEKAFSNDPIGHQAKFKNAYLSYYIGEFDWAKAQLDVLKASTSKLIANDAMDLALLISENRDEDSSTVGLSYYSKADLLLFRNKDDLAMKTLDSIGMLGLTHPLNDEVLFKKAQITLKNGHYTEADSLLAKLIEFYPEDILGDDAVYLEAQINEAYLNNKAKAMALYKQLYTIYPGSLFASDARKSFRRLRGDVIN